MSTLFCKYLGIFFIWWHWLVNVMKNKVPEHLGDLAEKPQ